MRHLNELLAFCFLAGAAKGHSLQQQWQRLLAIGLSVLLALQVFVVAGGVTDLIPLTGMTMPFLAQGGSSLVTNWILIALLVKLSDAARRPDPPVPQLVTPPPDAGAGSDDGDPDEEETQGVPRP